MARFIISVLLSLLVWTIGTVFTFMGFSLSNVPALDDLRFMQVAWIVFAGMAVVKAALAEREIAEALK